MVDDTKTSNHLTLLFFVTNKTVHIFPVKQLPNVFVKTAGVIRLYRYAYFEALIMNLQKQIDEVHFTVRQALSNWLNLRMDFSQ